ncbi:hypothetical protein BaRGS_00026441 [Batillaria attramentaria]|uniref:Uncharacterized protein n=1 Tax=Batillaria attramentaria TaxID=370345 RepID=A0ABD0K5E7_9CAEN
MFSFVKEQASAWTQGTPRTLILRFHVVSLNNGLQVFHLSLFRLPPCSPGFDTAAVSIVTPQRIFTCQQLTCLARFSARLQRPGLKFVDLGYLQRAIK